MSHDVQYVEIKRRRVTGVRTFYYDPIYNRRSVTKDYF